MTKPQTPQWKPSIGIVFTADGHVTKAADRKLEKKQ